MVVFDPKFRPWPHIYQDKTRSKKFYLHLEKHRERDIDKLRAFKGRADEEKYTGMVKRVLGYVGKGIISSLEFTMKDYLRQTDGRLQTGTREPWEWTKCKPMLSHNNAAERPFAISRAYKNMYPSLTLANLGKLSHSIANGTHRPRQNGLSAGIALTADPRLRNCVTQLCNVRRLQVTLKPNPSSIFTITPTVTNHGPYPHPKPHNKVGRITAYVRGETIADADEARVVRKRKAKERYVPH